jgi:hypothetical protein
MLEQWTTRLNKSNVIQGLVLSWILPCCCALCWVSAGESLGEAKTADKMMEEINGTAVIEYELGFKLAP